MSDREKEKIEKKEENPQFVSAKELYDAMTQLTEGLTNHFNEVITKNNATIIQDVRTMLNNFSTEWQDKLGKVNTTTSNKSGGISSSITHDNVQSIVNAIINKLSGGEDEGLSQGVAEFTRLQRNLTRVYVRRANQQFEKELAKMRMAPESREIVEEIAGGLHEPS